MKSRSLSERINSLFWAVVEMFGIEMPAGHRHTVSDDPRFDPYRLDFDLITPPR